MEPMDSGVDSGQDSGNGVDTGPSPSDSGFDTRSPPPDAGRDGGRRDASPDGPPPVDQGVQCGAIVCAPPLGCCLAGNTCTTSVGCTAGIGAWLPCDDRADCTGGDVCCANIHASGSVNSVQCVTAPDCAAIGAGNSGYELCDPNAPVPCTGGLTCSSNSTGASELNAYDTCQ